MADQGIWFKLWDGWENDGAISDLSKEDMLHWVLLGGYLKKHGNNGMVCLSKPLNALQKKLMLPSYEAVLQVLKRMPNCVVEEKQNGDVTKTVTDDLTVVTIRWKNWVKYQGDSSKFRMAKLRLKKSVTCDGDDVTLKKRREEKRREENKNTPFIPPTILEVQEFANQEKLPLDCQKFFNHYASKGWLVGKAKMRDWRAAARGAARDWACSTLAKATQPQWM